MPRLTLYVLSYEHIDITTEYYFTPETSPLDPVCDETVARQACAAAGWEGDGDFGLIWLPPFMLDWDTYGLMLWHVKQQNDGTSWICSDRPFETAGGCWHQVLVEVPDPN